MLSSHRTVWAVVLAFTLLFGAAAGIRAESVPAGRTLGVLNGDFRSVDQLKAGGVYMTTPASRSTSSPRSKRNRSPDARASDRKPWFVYRQVNVCFFGGA